MAVGRGGARSEKGGEPSGVTVAGSPRKWGPGRRMIHALMTLRSPEIFYLLGKPSFEWLGFKASHEPLSFTHVQVFSWPVFIRLPQPFLHHRASWPWPRPWLRVLPSQRLLAQARNFPAAEREAGVPVAPCSQTGTWRSRHGASPEPPSRVLLVVSVLEGA